jgi:hypothetical protein
LPSDSVSWFISSKATQCRQRIARYGREAVYNPKPVSFSIWFLICLRKCEKKGAKFTFLCPGFVRIKWPEQVPMLRTPDFEGKYENEYLSKF